MHEHGMARDLWKVVLDEAKKNNLTKITKVTIVLGVAAGVEHEILTHSFVDHIFPESEIAKDAVLEYEIEQLEAKCNVCDGKVIPSNVKSFVCPSCKANDITVISGRDVYIKSIEAQ